MASEALNEEMVATYAVQITGIERTKAEMARLDNEIKLLRKTNYGGSGGATVSEARFGTSASAKVLKGKDDIFVGSIDALEGRVQAGASSAMARGMALGKTIQAATLRAAVTPTGERRGGTPGREDSGALIGALATNVETQKVTAVTTIVGWHGWGRARTKYFEYQEKGTKGRKSGQQSAALNRKVRARRAGVVGRGVPAANSLGASIIVVREFLRRELGGLKK